jgi:hypothetical protein
MGWLVRRARLEWLLAGGLVMVAGTPALAEDPEGRVSLWLAPSWSYTSLDEANDFIDSGNRVFDGQDFTSVDDFHSLFSLGAEVNVGITDRFSAFGGVSTWFGSARESFNRVVEAKVTGSPIEGGLKYRLPVPESFEDALADLDFFVGAGMVLVPTLEFIATDEDRETAREFLEERTFKGDALGFGLRFDIEYFLSPKFTMMFGAHYRLISASNMEHTVKVDNPNAFNPTGDDDGDGIRNSQDADYSDPSGGERGNTERLYGSFVNDPENPGEVIWDRPSDRYLESLYIYDPLSYRGAPDAFQVYDPNAEFDLDLSGIELKLGLTYYIF